MDYDISPEPVKESKNLPQSDSSDYVLVESRFPGCIRKSFKDGRWEDWTTGENGELVQMVGRVEKF
jgi:hypothetical protein